MELYHNQPDHAGLQTKPDQAGLHPVQSYGHPQYLPVDAAYAQHQQQQYQGYATPQLKSTIFGLRRTTFWLVLVFSLILILAIVGGTVGGVVGSEKARESVVTTTISSSPSTTAPPTVIQPVTGTSASTTQRSTATHTGVSSQPSPSSTVLRDGCPGSNGTQWTSASGYNTFQIYCGVDFPVNDLLNGEWLAVANFDECLEFCASLNDKRNFTLCFGVAFAYDNSPNASCYLKNPAIDVTKSGTINKLTDSGILIS